MCNVHGVRTEVCEAGGQHTVKDNQRWCDRCRPVSKDYERVLRWRADYARQLQAAPSEIAVRMKAGAVGQADAILEGMEDLLRLLRRRNRGQL